MYFRLLYNTISEYSQKQTNFSLNSPIESYGFGITLKSPFGPIDLIWGQGPESLINSSKKQTLFYINVGYKF